MRLTIYYPTLSQKTVGKTLTYLSKVMIRFCKA